MLLLLLLLLFFAHHHHVSFYRFSRYCFGGLYRFNIFRGGHHASVTVYLSICFRSPCRTIVIEYHDKPVPFSIKSPLPQAFMCLCTPCPSWPLCFQSIWRSSVSNHTSQMFICLFILWKFHFMSSRNMVHLGTLSHLQSYRNPYKATAKFVTNHFSAFTAVTALIRGPPPGCHP